MFDKGLDWAGYGLLTAKQTECLQFQPTILRPKVELDFAYPVVSPTPWCPHSAEPASLLLAFPRRPGWTDTSDNGSDWGGVLVAIIHRAYLRRHHEACNHHNADDEPVKGSSPT